MIGKDDLPGVVEDQDKAGETIQNIQQLGVAADGFALVLDFNLGNRAVAGMRRKDRDGRSCSAKRYWTGWGLWREKLCRQSALPAAVNPILIIISGIARFRNVFLPRKNILSIPSGQEENGGAGQSDGAADGEPVRWGGCPAWLFVSESSSRTRRIC